MLTYVVTFVFALIIWKIVVLVIKWRTNNKCIENLPLIDIHHWFFGILHKVKHQNDILDVCLPFVEKKSPRWFVAWILFLHPNATPVQPEAIQAVLSAKDIPKNHGLNGPYRIVLPWIGDGLLVSGGEKWARNRRLLTPAFHFDILKPYVNIFNDVTDTFLDKMAVMSQSGTSFDVCPLIARATLHALLRCALSYGDDSIQALGHAHPYVSAIEELKSKVIYRAVNPQLYFDVIYRCTSHYRKFKKLCDYVHKFSTDVITERRKAIEQDPSQLDKRHLDFLDILITARDGEGAGLSDKEIQDEVDTFMFEGHDTTASAISWAIYCMAKYPDMRRKIREEVATVLEGRQRLTADDLTKLPYTTCFIKEVLRMYSPVPMTSRKLDTPRTIDGIDFPEGQVIDVFPHLVHHNPAVWENNWEFIPERFLPENIAKKHPFAFVPFAAGQRNCIGQHFAMNEIKVMVCRVAQRFDLTPDSAKEPVPFAEIVMTSKNGVHIVAKERE